MPKMSLEEKSKIMDKAKFLKNKGYKVTSEDDFGMDFVTEKIEFYIYYDRFIGGRSSILIRFLDKVGLFSVGWLAFFFEWIKIDENLSNVEVTLNILDFIENNYEKAICYENYIQLEKLVEKYMKNGVRGIVSDRSQSG